MENHKPITRDIFIRLVAGLIFSLTGWTWYRLTIFQSGRNKRLEFRHNTDIPLGISYFGKYYIYRSIESVRAFSVICTHAGCLIDKSHGDILQCNCHGSRFESKTGNPVKGPAIKPLHELECRFDPKTNQWVVKLNSDQTY
jgi:Rieske Fe-S protein